MSNTNYDIVKKVSEASVARMNTDELKAYMEWQMALFRSKGLNPNRALTEKIERTGEYTKFGVEMFKITKRENPLMTVNDDAAENGRNFTPAPLGDKILTNAHRRGKYNDENRLLGIGEVCSVEVGETQSFRSLD